MMEQTTERGSPRAGNRSAASSVPTIMYISPGPTYKPHSAGYQSFWIAQSRRFAGHILTTAPTSETFGIGAFVYTSMKSRNRPLDSLRFVAFCLSRTVALRLKRQRIDLVATYDPLKTGLIGVFAARILGAKLAPEVNGVYTASAAWEDGERSLMNTVKRRMVPPIMRFVLKRSNGARLLFAGQLAPFESLLGGKIVRAFPRSVSAAFESRGEDKEVLFVGFPFKLKGVDILIEAFKKVSGRYPDWRLKILGWYPDPRQLHAAMDGHPQICHHPPVAHAEMVEHIGRCAILVLPSRSEAMGRVLVEAMAAEKPRIGSNVGGIPTVIRDGVDGYLFEPGNVDDLAQKLDTLMGDPELRRVMGRAGKARVAVEFGPNVYLNRVADFYHDVLTS